jgi:hypothetical protein
MTDNHVHFTELDFLGVRGLELLSTRILPLCILEFMCDHSHISASLIYFLHDPTLFMQPASEMLTQAAPNGHVVRIAHSVVPHFFPTEQTVI